MSAAVVVRLSIDSKDASSIPYEVSYVKTFFAID